jgi:hypothetical protein
VFIADSKKGQKMSIKKVMIFVILGMMCVSCSKKESQTEPVETAKEGVISEKEDAVIEEKEQNDIDKEVTKDNFRDFPVSDESIFSIRTVDDGVEIEGCKRDIRDKVIVVPETINGKNVVSIGFGAFTEIGSVEAIVLPDSVERTGEGAFTGCEKLKYVYLGAGLKSTGNKTFVSCSSLKEIELPDGMTTIHGGLVVSCPGLEVITVPATVQNIEVGIVSSKEFTGVIRTPKGSAAEKYALENGIKVENY